LKKITVQKQHHQQEVETVGLKILLQSINKWVGRSSTSPFVLLIESPTRDTAADL